MYELSYLADAAVDAALDHALRGLLTLCFTEPEDHVFRTQRFVREPAAHRWLVRDGAGGLVAQTALHDKLVTSGEARLAIGGVAEVCVAPDHRRRGLVTQMLAAIDGFLRERGIPLALLFGDPEVYRSSGYRPAGNLLHRDASGDPRSWMISDGGMYKELVPGSWPSAPVYLDGPTF